MYTVIGTTRSRTFRVLWMLEELSQPYEHLPYAPRAPEVLAKNPTGKVPVLLDGDQTLTDSVAIMTYLADKHGNLTAPAGTIARARQDAMALWLIDEMDALLWAAAKHSFILPEEQRQPAVKDCLKAEFRANAEALSAKLNGPFLIGEQFSLPDILAVHCLNWSVGAKFPRLPDKLHKYAKRLRERPAYRTAFER
ncbi:MAG: glutathione S-transferase [Pseudomonadota bacterium]